MMTESFKVVSLSPRDKELRSRVSSLLDELQDLDPLAKIATLSQFIGVLILMTEDPVEDVISMMMANASAANQSLNDLLNNPAGSS